MKSDKRVWVVQVEIALEFARGMAYMHSRKPVLIHRDLKPANVMIGGSSFMLADTNLLLNSAGTVKVADFGLSKSLPKLTAAAHESKADVGIASDKYTLTGVASFLCCSCVST
jgi:serine/threonine protein kinase